MRVIKDSVNYSDGRIGRERADEQVVSKDAWWLDVGEEGKGGFGITSECFISDDWEND